MPDSAGPGQPPAAPHQRVDVSALSLEQKASLLSGRDFWSTKALPEAGIGSVVMTDGPHGVRLQTGDADHLGLNRSAPATCFPPAVAVGSSWDPDVARRLGAAVGEEARALGVGIVLGPGVNIKRSPLCGRNFEYYSEDPLLSGRLGAAHVAGLQERGVGASVKHFAANNQETERMRISADVDERTLREIYLAAFEHIVRTAAPATVMCSYNRINGVYSSQNPWLLTTVLREEWGFTGAVVSDWGAVADRVAALEAGLDLQMPGNGGLGDAEVVQAVRDGRVDEAVVDAGAARAAALAGLAREPEGGIDVDAHHRLARELAAGCAVLLKNDAVLPLDGPQRLLVVGEFAVAPRFQGGGSSHISPTRVDLPLEAVRALAAERGGAVEYRQGFSLDGGGDSQALIVDAVRAAEGCDVAVVFAGLADQDESEGVDRTGIDLPAAQVGVIRAVAAAAPRTVVVLSNGGVVSLEGWHDEVDAILEGWLLGQAGGGALADLLFGVANPSGRLAETIPLRLQDTPSYLNFPGELGHVRYGEGVMVGYRGFETAGRRVRYPFGHGLSYTTFNTSALTAAPTGPDSAVVSVRVTNTGTRAGGHVVQCYVAAGDGPVRRPERELRAFAKVFLEPGEEREIRLELDRRAFAFWDTPAGGWRVAGGRYRIQIGESAAWIVAEAGLQLDGDRPDTALDLDSTLGEWLSHPAVGPVLRQALAALAPGGTGDAGADLLEMISSMPMGRFLNFTGAAVPREQLEQLMALSRRA